MPAVADIDPRWEAFATREPYFAVLTAPRFLAARRTVEDEQAFFATGEVLVDAMFTAIEQRLQPKFAPLSVLEYGCGIGRLAMPFARRGASVVAVDRSPAMLTAARAEIARHGVDGIDLQTPAELFAAPRKFDLVCCYLVLQRRPPEDGLALLRQLLDRLGPGGICAFQLPYRAETGALRTLSRTLRAHVPGVNALANLALGKPSADPFVPTYAYALDDVADVLRAASITASHVVFDHGDGMDMATFYAQVPHAAASAGSGDRQTTASDAVDVQALIANTSLEDLNRSAEEYFSTLTDWEHHLAKPFSTPDETPALLVDIAALLQGLRPAKGATVLEFGAGTGWLSRYLTQLGCHAILLDVSPTALRIAETLYQRQPIIGDQPAPMFLPFDGRRIDLPDASVDRIIVFHAFHHAANPGELLHEFSRVLRPGGVAGFAEPGPRHSQSPLSQFEMRTYGVIENDIDIHAIWRAARQAGFQDIQLAAFHTPPFHVSLAQYEDLLAGGVTSARWLESTRGFLRHVRTFFLHKAGAAAGDSRSGAGLSCEIAAVLQDADEPVGLDVTVANNGTAVWLPAGEGHGAVFVGAHVYDAAGKLLAFDAARARLSEDERRIEPGTVVRARLILPRLDAGRYIVELDCVADGVTWFAQRGSHPARVTVDIV